MNDFRSFFISAINFTTANNATSFDNLLEWNIATDTNVTQDNITTNGSLLETSDGEQLADLILMGLLSIVLGLMILVTVIGELKTSTPSLMHFVYFS